jgi:hypothetical protein
MWNGLSSRFLKVIERGPVLGVGSPSMLNGGRGSGGQGAAPAGREPEDERP